MRSDWGVVVQESFNRFIGKLLAFLPNLLAMATILLVGLLIAWILKKVVFHFLKAIHFDKRSEQWGFTRLLGKGGVTYTPTHLVSRFFYWIIVLITLILGLNALDVPATQSFVAAFFNYLPHLFVAMMILVIGYLIAVFLGEATLIAAVNAKIDSARLLSRAVRWFLMVLSITMTLYHLGIAEKVIVAAFVILLGGSTLALAIAFGWAGKDLARDFLEKVLRKKEGKGTGDGISHL